MLHFLFLVANILLHSRLSLVSLQKNTSSKQDLHCIVFYEARLEKSGQTLKRFGPNILRYINPIQDKGGKKHPPPPYYQFFSL